MKKIRKQTLYERRKMCRWKIIDTNKGKTLGFSKKAYLHGIIELDVHKIPPGMSILACIRFAEQSGILLRYYRYGTI